MEFTGKIIHVGQERGGVSKTTGNEWKVQEYVIEDHSQFPKKMCFEVFGADRISQFAIQLGEELTVSFDIDARQWQDRWFNSIRAWKVDRVNAQQATNPQPAPSADVPLPPADQIASAQFVQGDEKVDLPF